MNYYLPLSRTQQTNRTDEQNWEPWINIFLKTMVLQKDNLAFKINDERQLRVIFPALSRSILRMASTARTLRLKELIEETHYA